MIETTATQNFTAIFEELIEKATDEQIVNLNESLLNVANYVRLQRGLASALEAEIDYRETCRHCEGAGKVEMFAEVVDCPGCAGDGRILIDAS